MVSFISLALLLAAAVNAQVENYVRVSGMGHGPVVLPTPLVEEDYERVSGMGHGPVVHPTPIAKEAVTTSA